MKNLFENLAIIFLFILTALTIFLIVQYNMIDDSDKVKKIVDESVEKPKVPTYLENMESYRDIDVKVDSQKETMPNTMVIKSKSNKYTIERIVSDDTKSSYIENLEDYSQKSENGKLDEPKSVIGELEKVEDTIGMAIDTLLDD